MDALKKPVYDYVEGWYDKDPERMKEGLHPALAKRSPDSSSSNGVHDIDRTELLSVVQQYGGAGKDERTIEIEILDVQEQIASVKVTSNQFVDYLHLIKQDGKWLIINVLWCYR